MKTTQFFIDSAWFARDATSVAPALIGCTLCHLLPNGRLIRGQIVETEAYMPHDPACHAYKRVTPRTQIMFGPVGFAYVYLIYGMYLCLNVVTGPEGSGQAVLLRAAALDGSEDPRAAAGPGKLCRAFEIGKLHNGLLFHPDSGLWFEADPLMPQKRSLFQTTRIGISHAKDMPWRWLEAQHPAVSVKPRNIQEK